jgi:hypothetical protein
MARREARGGGHVDPVVRVEPVAAGPAPERGHVAGRRRGLRGGPVGPRLEREHDGHLAVGGGSLEDAFGKLTAAADAYDEAEVLVGEAFGERRTGPDQGVVSERWR